MSERCHLSGLPIDENSPVLLLPVRFGAVTEYALCYQSDRLVQAFFAPITGVLADDYGNIKTSGAAAELFRQHIEINLADNSRYCQLGDEPKFSGFDPSCRYAAIRRENHNEAQVGEFCNESELLTLHQEPNKATNRYQLKTVTMKETLSLLRRASLSQLSGGHLYRLSYIIIDKNFFENLVSSHYQPEFNQVKDGLMALALNAPEHQKADDEENLDTWLLFCLENRAIEIMSFDSSDHPRAQILKPLRKNILRYHNAKGSEDEALMLSELTEWIDVLTCYAILQRVYSHLGKTFYPQVSRANNERQNQFTAFLYAQQEKRRKAKRNEYSPKNGYDKETQDRYQWS